MPEASVLKQLPSQLSPLRRALRYVSTFRWLAQHQLEAAPWPTLLALGTGVVSRLGTVAVFAATIKSAHWLLMPRPIPAWISSAVPAAHDVVVALALVVPSLAMLCVATATVLHRKHLREAAFRCVKAWLGTQAQRSVESAFSSHANEAVPGHVARILASDITTDFSLFYRAQINLLRLAVVAITLFVAAFIGLAIDPLVTSIVFAVAGLLVAGVVWTRHQAAHGVKRIQERARQSNATLTQELTDQFSAPAESRSLASLLETVDRHSNELLARSAAAGRNDSISKFAIDVGQCLLLFVLMLVIYMRGSQLDATAVANILILVIVLRFAMGQVRHFAGIALDLSKDYPMLAAFSQGKDVGWLRRTHALPSDPSSSDEI